MLKWKRTCPGFEVAVEEIHDVMEALSGTEFVDGMFPGFARSIATESILLEAIDAFEKQDMVRAKEGLASARLSLMGEVHNFIKNCDKWWRNELTSRLINRRVRDEFVSPARQAVQNLEEFVRTKLRFLEYGTEEAKLILIEASVLMRTVKDKIEEAEKKQSEWRDEVEAKAAAARAAEETESRRNKANRLRQLISTRA